MARIKAKRQKRLVKQMCVLAVAAIMLSVLSAFQLGNPYLRSDNFETITVQRQESVWDIASRYSADNKQIRCLTDAIIEINALSHDAEVKAGQQLQVPLLPRANDSLTKVAER